MAPFDAIFENIIKNGAFALLEQMLHFLDFQKYSNLEFFQCYLKIEKRCHDLKIAYGVKG